MDTTGKITYIAEIDTSKADRDMVRLRSSIDGAAKDGESSLGRLGNSFGKLTKAAKVATLAAGATFAAGATAAAKASWDQVNAVQQASATLGRYYDSASDVTKVQQSLIKYAQSDMGVLFNRKDLFAAASNLAMYGSSAKDVTSQVQILSRGMASNVLTWDEMNAVVGRVISSGKLQRTEFEMLAKAGYNLDSELANTNVTAEEFFKILDNSIPKDISQDMDNIVPVGVRLQTAFRNIGNAILGVNDLQDGFFGGSVGDRIIKGMQGATTAASNLAPTIRDVTKRMLATADAVWKELQPSFSNLASVITGTVLPAIKDIISSPIAQFLGTTLVAAVKASVDVLGALLSVASQVTRWFVTATPVIGSVIAAFAAYKAAVIGINTVMGIKNALLVAQGTQYMLLNGQLIIVRGATVAQTIAQTALNTAMSLNPIGLVVAAVAGLTAAYFLSTSQTDNNKNATDRLNGARAAAKVAADNLKLSTDNLRGAELGVEAAEIALARARERLSSLQQSGTATALDLREATNQVASAEDGLRRANDGVRAATEEKNKAEQQSAEKRKAVSSAEADKKAAFDRTATSVQYSRDSVTELNRTLDILNNRTVTYNVKGNVDSSAAKGPGQRFSGGPVSANTPYLVGENRDGSINKTTEMFVPKSAGNIVSSSDLQDALKGGSGGGRTTTIGNVYLANDVDADRFIRRLSDNQATISNGLVPNKRYA